MIDTLEQAGLTNGEARVYVALTELGLTTTGAIVNHSGVTKSIIYQILEKLIDQGLASFVYKGKTKYFQAAPPDNLIDFLEAQEKQLEKTKADVAKIIPELLLKQNATSKSVATVYEGFKGIMTVYQKRFEKLSEGDEYLNLGLPATQPKHHHAFWQKDHFQRVEKKIKAKLLYNADVGQDVLDNRNSFWGCDARRMPVDIETPSWILLYKDTVVIAIPQGVHPIAIEIVNQDVADSFTRYFEWYWKKSKKEKK